MRTWSTPLLDVVWIGVPAAHAPVSSTATVVVLFPIPLLAHPLLLLALQIPPRGGSSCVGGRWFPPSSYPTKGSSFPGRSYDPLPLQSLVGPPSWFPTLLPLPSPFTLVLFFHTTTSSTTINASILLWSRSRHLDLVSSPRQSVHFL